MMISVFDRIENFVGRGENAGYQHFLLFPQCFQRVKKMKCVQLFNKRLDNRQLAKFKANTDDKLKFAQLTNFFFKRREKKSND